MGGLFDSVMLTKVVTHTADAAAVAVPGEATRLGGAHSTIYVPMIKDDAGRNSRYLSPGS